MSSTLAAILVDNPVKYGLLKEKLCILIKISLSLSNWQQVSIGPCKGLTPNRQQFITWNNDDAIYWPPILLWGHSGLIRFIPPQRCSRDVPDGRVHLSTCLSVLYSILSVLKIRTICLARDLWKLARSCKQLHLVVVIVIFTRGQFWPSGIVVACVCLSVCVSVRASITSLSAR